MFNFVLGGILTVVFFLGQGMLSWPCVIPGQQRWTSYQHSPSGKTLNDDFLNKYVCFSSR